MQKKIIPLLLLGGSLVLVGGCDQIRFTDPKKPETKAEEKVEPQAQHPREALGLTTTHKLKSLNPNKLQTAYELSAMNMVGEGLFRLEKDGSISPGVSNGEIERNDKNVIIHLKPEAQWSNNDPVTASDFVYAWQELLNPKHNNFYAYKLLDLVDNASAVSSGEVGVDQLHAQALDDHRLKITLKDPDMDDKSLKQALAFPALFPLPKNFIGQITYDLYGQKSINTLSNGPYNLSGWESGWDTWTYDRNEEYHAWTDYPTEKLSVQYVKNTETAKKSYQQRLTDILISRTPEEDWTALKRPFNQNLLYHINQAGKKNILNDQRLRDLLAQNIDRQALTETLPSLQSSYSLDPQSEGQVQEKTALDNEKSMQALLEDYQFEAIELDLITDDNALSQKIAKELQKQWESKIPHLVINIFPLSEKVLMERFQKGDFDLYLSQQQAYDNYSNNELYLPYTAPNYQKAWENDLEAFQELMKQSASGRLSDEDRSQADQLIQKHQIASPILKGDYSYLSREEVIDQAPYSDKGFLFDFKNMAYEKSSQTIPIKADKKKANN
ncbi:MULTISPECIES: ABC transporter substrate-binding protein [Aerococcus]|uniref:ABC transporter substrate-binding protein n=1 Tax=Aerococcus TaxID=1375 RepID=UPI0015EB8B18|nr:MULTISPECIES: ABC transporter substrate-binding protein [Aerococcus]MDK6687888.1 ABC transporter substrate-binding protein [Aerococcus urinae]MDK8132351.1 ABC transporter substrate-binding protein [Aerococcus urinae]MDK8484297.1 ABC transporter substrate-binding protein [Aerococcus urinae]MDL5178039.1 ABC transporter substrate-binding protein [Aerococcus tenax]MDL5207055.1 ABC transporter substrate-binding protein [Aerococcus tenax]